MWKIWPVVLIALSGAAQAADFPAGEWTVTAVAGQPVSPGQGVTIVFDGDRVAGRSGCNRYFGAVNPGDGPLFGALGGTRMACDPAAMDLEARFMQTMAQVDGYDIDKEFLTLFVNSDAVLTARR